MYIVESGSVNDRVLLFFHKLKVMYIKLCEDHCTHMYVRIIVCVYPCSLSGDGTEQPCNDGCWTR